MKASPYNHFFELQDGRTVLAYNSYSGALAEIERENYSRILELLTDSGAGRTPQDDEFLQCLQVGGFLIPDHTDQPATVKVRNRTVRRDGLLLALTIAPTLACNFACDYCFESRGTPVMSPETQEALIRFTDHHLVRAEALRVTWFGGEPTLCLSLIEKLQRRFLELTEKHGSEVIPGQIISNGYLLDAPTARRLKELQVANAQVTIDGPREVHDRRRKLRTGQGSFDRILDNLCQTCEILSINVRINVDRENIDSAAEVTEILQQRGILSRVRVTYAQVQSSGVTCADIRDRCYDNATFADLLVRIYGRLASRGILGINSPRVGSGASCGAVADGNFVVSPNGHLFRCWEDLSMDATRSIGSLFSDAPDEDQKRTLDAYRIWDPFKMPGCRACSILPICLGGCPLSTIEKPDAPHGECSPWKYNLGQITELAYIHQAPTSPGTPESE